MPLDILLPTTLQLSVEGISTTPTMPLANEPPLYFISFKSKANL